MPDGRSFLIDARYNDTTTPITVLLYWAADLKGLPQRRLKDATRTNWGADPPRSLGADERSAGRLERRSV